MPGTQYIEQFKWMLDNEDEWLTSADCARRIFPTADGRQHVLLSKRMSQDLSNLYFLGHLSRRKRPAHIMYEYQFNSTCIGKRDRENAPPPMDPALLHGMTNFAFFCVKTNDKGESEVERGEEPFTQ